MDRQEVEALAWKLTRSTYEVHRRRFAFIREFRRRVQEYSAAQPVKLDPATILMLLQLAIQLWKWAKDNGYLSLPESMPAGGPDLSKIGVVSEVEAVHQLKAWDGFATDFGDDDA